MHAKQLQKCNVMKTMGQDVTDMSYFNLLMIFQKSDVASNQLQSFSVWPFSLTGIKPDCTVTPTCVGLHSHCMLPVGFHNDDCTLL